jgi:c-di-GMP phosphodiesterase
MKLRWPSVTKLAIVAASLITFVTGGHFAAKAFIEGQQSKQLQELASIALRRSEVAVDFGAATLDDLAKRGPLSCDPASLQAVRLQVYQRSAVKDIRLVRADGTVICSAYSETLEFDNAWVDRSDMLRSDNGHLLLFRVDQLSGIALGVLRNDDQEKSLVAILGINSYLFDIMPAELRAQSEVELELNNGANIARFALKNPSEFTPTVSYDDASSRYPLHATLRIERAALAHWNSEAYWPALSLAAVLGLMFGLLLTRATTRLEGPVADIDRGLARGEFRPFFQPTFDLKTGEIRGCEVLARWIREDGTIVPPISFIPIAESSGRIERMTWQILSAALTELYPRLHDDKLFKLSVNVVPQHLVAADFIKTLRRVVANARVSPRQIVLEITERTELPDPKKAALVVKELRELGFRVAMDDVGVGHSGLSQMKGLGANTIKIDKFFIDTITQDGSSAIVEMLVRLARDLQMTVIAEGIETDDQVQTLIACGVEEGQGYFVSPPLPFAKFDELLEVRRAKAFAEAAVRDAAMVA